jgi:hypothetical protein
LIEKRNAENKEKEEEMKVAESEEAENVWEKVGSYIDFKSKKDEGEEKEKETSRLRKLLLELKNEKK